MVYVVNRHYLSFLRRYHCLVHLLYRTQVSIETSGYSSGQIPLDPRTAPIYQTRSKHVELVPHYQRKPANDLSVLGRNCSLFEQARHYAYQVAKMHRTENELIADIKNFCFEHNLFTTPLQINEVRSIAQSVGRWTWKHRHEVGTRRRLLQLDQTLPLAERQSIGATHAASVKRKATEEKIIQAIGDLTAAGKRATKAEVSRVTGLHRKTLERIYGHLFHGLRMDT